MDRLLALPRRVRRTVLARRRPLAAVLAALAVGAAVQAASPPAPPTRLVLTAARDLPAGTVVTHGDLARVAFAPGSVPVGVVASASAAVGRTTAAPLRAGEPVTDVRRVGASLLDGYPGLVAAPVRIADPGAVGLLRVGDRVDGVAADPQGRAATEVVAEGAVVVSLPEVDEGALATGGLVVLAVPEETAHELAGAGVTRYLSVLITG